MVASGSQRPESMDNAVAGNDRTAIKNRTDQPKQPVKELTLDEYQDLSRKKDPISKPFHLSHNRNKKEMRVLIWGSPG